MAVIASVGDNCIDRYVGAVERESPGGNALNVAARTAGAYYGAVGDDEAGRTIVAGARAAGVDVSNVEVRAGSSGVTIVSLDEHGDRRFLLEEYGVVAEYRLTDAVVGRLRGHPWVHGVRQPDLQDVASTLRAGGARLSYDFCDAWDDELVAALAPQLDVAFFSAGPEAAERACALGAVVGIATLGKHGSVAFTGAERVSLSARPAAVVDTLGAGDAFIAACIGALADGHALAAALDLGAESAAVACSHFGAWPDRVAAP